jgi:hypothetical protein
MRVGQLELQLHYTDLLLPLLLLPLLLQVVIAMLIGQLELQLHPSVGGWDGLLQRRMYHTTLQVEGGLPVLLRPRVRQ